MATTLASRRLYRQRVSKSLCRKKTMRKCNRVKGCKNTKKTAKKPRYCRKKHNKHLKQKGGAPGDRLANIRNMLDPLNFGALGVIEEEPINNREQCLNKCNDDFTTGKKNAREHRSCKRACMAVGGRRTRRHSHIKTHKSPMTAKVTDVHGEWHSVDMPSVSPSMRKEIEEECREKCHGRNRKECRDRCRRRLLDRAVEAQFGGKSLDCMAVCMEEQKNKRPRPSKVRALRECRENCHQGRGLQQVYQAAQREGILEPQNENQ